MATWSPALLDEIRASTDLVELVGRFVNLKRAGQNWKGLCPFHAEKTPSFMVNPAKGIFHCFGCGVGGDAFGFLMRQDRLTFPEAVRALARSAGIALPEERTTPADAGREDLYRVMDLAARFYAEALWKPGGERARRYLEGRGVDPEVARRFGLGASPDAWDGLLQFMRAQGVGADRLELVGLAIRRESGTGHYDRFRGRLMFAIRDLQGRVVAFGGRSLGDDQPKYLNSPETPLYTKGNLLYAADLARASMREKNRALLVEGYLDCLMAHQHGFTETVAALGTAFTPAQLAILRRSCEEVVTFFDADAAGQKAAERAAELLETSETPVAWAVTRTGGFEAGPVFRLRAAVLPAGDDPDTFLRRHGAAAFAERIAAARSLLAYALDRALADPDGATGPRARANAFARVALMLAKVADAEEAAALSREAATRLGVDPTQLWIEAQRLQGALRRPPAAVSRPAPSGGADAQRAQDRALVRLLLQHPAARPELLPLIPEDEPRAAPLRAVVAALRQRPEASPESLLSDLDEAARSVVTALLMDDDARFSDDVGAAVAGFRRHLEREQRRRRQREIARTISDAQSAVGAAGTPRDAFLALHQESKAVYETVGGIAQSLEHRDVHVPRDRTSQGVERHE